jgi:hypothetical protein
MDVECIGDADVAVAGLRKHGVAPCHGYDDIRGSAAV